MAGGPVHPSSAFPVTAPRVFPNFHVGAGANSKQEEGLAFEASLGADAIWRLRYDLPTTLPTGTLTLRLRCLANATSGAAKLNPKWATVAPANDPSSATLTAEGTQTLTWAAGDADDYRDVDVALDAVTALAGNTIALDLTGETTGWTLAAILTLRAYLLWV